MEILIVILLAVLIVISTAALIISIKNKPKEDNSADEIKPVAQKLTIFRAGLIFLHLRPINPCAKSQEICRSLRKKIISR